MNRKFLNAFVQKLSPYPIVEINVSQYVDVTLNRIKGKLAINLVNTSGPHDNNDVLVFDEVLPVGPISFSIRIDKKPQKSRMNLKEKNRISIRKWKNSPDNTFPKNS